MKPGRFSFAGGVCPFCGRLPSLEPALGRPFSMLTGKPRHAPRLGAVIRCINPRCPVRPSTRWAPTKTAALARWLRRPPPPEVRTGEAVSKRRHRGA